jgi:3' terminal RNA ribose 2'-O-methyltransferase Hen1
VAGGWDDGGVLLTITTTHRPASDLGYLLVKHPDRVFTADTAAGTAYVFYPEVGDARCTAALLLEVAPDRLEKLGRRGGAADLGQYVNDRPYAASSLLSVALAKAFSSALRGTSRDRPELAGSAIPLEIGIPALPCGGDPALVARLFGPLGWQVTADALPLVPAGWGTSRYASVRLRGTLRLADALNHLYVLLPVLDNAKHYWVTTDEVDKLLRAGTGWLAGHPDRALITARYLAHQRSLTTQADQALTALTDTDSTDTDTDTADPLDEDATLPEPAGATRPAGQPAAAGGPRAEVVPLAELRREAVLAELAGCGARRVLDLGCGSGSLLARLVREPRYTEIVGADVSARALELADRRLRRLTERNPALADRVRLVQTGLTYRDARLRGYDAAVLTEVVEHLDPDRLPALERAVLGDARPGTVLVTTPNVEYNAHYPGLTGLRHPDHRFEWTRAEFAGWAERAADRYGYAVRMAGIGDADAAAGTPTQLAVFTRAAAAPTARTPG